MEQINPLVSDAMNVLEQIKFKKGYYPLMCEGKKTQTMRLARKRLDVQEGDVALAVFPGMDKTLLLKIRKVGYKQFKSIGLDDAVREGFESVADLKNELLKIYPIINKWDRLYYYQFEVVR